MPPLSPAHPPLMPLSLPKNSSRCRRTPCMSHSLPPPARPPSSPSPVAPPMPASRPPTSDPFEPAEELQVLPCRQLIPQQIVLRAAVMTQDAACKWKGMKILYQIFLRAAMMMMRRPAFIYGETPVHISMDLWILHLSRVRSSSQIPQQGEIHRSSDPQILRSWIVGPLSRGGHSTGPGHISSQGQTAYLRADAHEREDVRHAMPDVQAGDEGGAAGGLQVASQHGEGGGLQGRGSCIHYGGGGMWQVSCLHHGWVGGEYCEVGCLDSGLRGPSIIHALWRRGVSQGCHVSGPDSCPRLAETGYTGGVHRQGAHISLRA